MQACTHMWMRTCIHYLHLINEVDDLSTWGEFASWLGNNSNWHCCFSWFSRGMTLTPGSLPTRWWWISPTPPSIASRDMCEYRGALLRSLARQTYFSSAFEEVDMFFNLTTTQGKCTHFQDSWALWSGKVVALIKGISYKIEEITSYFAVFLVRQGNCVSLLSCGHPFWSCVIGICSCDSQWNTSDTH